MSGYYDVYVLAPERSDSLVWRFLDLFAPQREFSAEEVAVLEEDSREVFFTSCEEAVAFCCASPHRSVSLYWRNLSPPPGHAMVFFMEDGHLVLGVSTAEHEAQSALARLKRFCGPASRGYVGFEQPPVATAAEFLARCD